MIFIVPLFWKDEEKGKEGAGKEDVVLSLLYNEKKKIVFLHLPAETVTLQRKILKIYWDRERACKRGRGSNCCDLQHSPRGWGLGFWSRTTSVFYPVTI